MSAALTFLTLLAAIMPNGAGAQALRSTRLDAVLIEARSRVIDNSVIESTYRATIRAYGGDILLPAYSEDVVHRPVFLSDAEKSNAIIPTSATVRIDRELPASGGRYVLKQYEEAGIVITVTSQVIPSAMISERLIFKTQLASLIWKPLIQQYNEDEVGNPLLDVSSLGWETNPVIVFKSIPVLAPALAAKRASNPDQYKAPMRFVPKKGFGFANVFGAFGQIFGIVR